MKVGSLFSGIGGFDLAAINVGHDVVWQCEINPWCRDLLAARFPDVTRYNDIRLMEGKLVESVDMIVGGFPCQDLSVAGKQAGLVSGVRSSLWFEMLRLITEINPRFVLIENVLGVRKFLPAILDGLRSAGYAAHAEVIAAGPRNAAYGRMIRTIVPHIGAPHHRQRYWILAERVDVDSDPLEVAWRLRASLCVSQDMYDFCTSEVWPRAANRFDTLPTAVASDGKGGRRSTANNDEWMMKAGVTLTDWVLTNGSSPEPWERGQPRMLITASKLKRSNRMRRLVGLGNAIVPQIAMMIMRNLEVALVNSSSPISSASYWQWSVETSMVWPTPRASDSVNPSAYGTKSQRSRAIRGQLDAVVSEVERATGPLNPDWVELLMGYPVGWTN